MEQSLGVQFGLGGLTGEYVILEQAPYESGAGYTTKIDLVQSLSDSLYSTGGVSIECGVEDDWSLSIYMFAYPSDPALLFHTGVTHGVVGGVIHQDIEVTEIVQFKLNTETSTRYPVLGILSKEWQGQTYTNDGSLTPVPTLSVDGRVVSVDKSVYGQCVLKYRTFRKRYQLLITPREDSVENVYQSVFYAVWNGGVRMEEVEAPPGAEDDYAGGVTCGWRSILNVIPRPDKPQPPTLSSADTQILVDYCTQLRR